MTIGAAILPNGLPDPSMPMPSEIQVVEAVNQATQYRLRFGLNIEDGDLAILNNSLLDPESILAVVIRGEPIPSILVSGPVVRQDISFAHGGEGSKVDVHGMDASVAMDRENKSVVRSNINDSTAVMEILAGYAIVPDVSVTTTFHTDLKHPLVQRETDLRFIRRLARRNGFWFWLTEEAPGVTIGHFKLPPTDGSPEQELRINISEPNIDSMTLHWNSEAPVSASLTQLDLGNLSAIDGSSERSSITGLADQHLADIAPSTRQMHLAVPADDAGDLSSRGNAALMENGWFVRAQINVRQSRLNGIIRAHTLVNLDGAGTRHSGKYLVSRVVHDINEEDHMMTVDLIRNGWNG
ncbi:hypothetical protein [Aliikangiella coralliicola]|uniref:Phage late control D family protein n=1 Tax=Aliikangiella coralliicola TaxID=2592383 RepID=A0A545UE59_9GAMM|nr:hypothetical protein [Aliikangiella coralliicola]TQV87764.1 hypothetical protein FLL46_10280 [Aliikangiella coralliicola]